MNAVGISTTTLLTLISNCTAGSYAVQSVPVLDPLGTYSNQYNCTGCSRGKFGNVPRSEDEAQGCAYNCSSGRYGGSTGLSADKDCKACPSGKFGAGAGLTAEIDACPGVCPAGKHGTGEGLTSEVAAPTPAPSCA
jgi:hypothetical protein